MMIFYLLIRDEHVQVYASYDLDSHTVDITEKYHSVLKNWSEVPNAENSFILTPKDYEGENIIRLSKDESNGYKSDVIKMGNDSVLKLYVTVTETALYNINIDYFDLSESILSHEGAIKINGVYPFYEATQIAFPMKWQVQTTKFAKDRYNNELLPTNEKTKDWLNTDVIDGSYITSEPLKFKLDKGQNEITITCNNGNLLIGDISFTAPKEIETYKDYINKYQNEPKIKSLNKIEVEYIDYKSDPSVRIYSDTDPSSSRYKTNRRLLNAIDQNSWTKGGQSVTWIIDVKESGLYNLAFKYQQNALVNLPSFRTIKIDNEIPFKEMINYPFHYSKDWTNEILHSKEGNYYFYLSKGKHQISMTAVLDPYQPIIDEIDRIMDEITILSLDIKKLTGNKIDKYRDWKITEYIPDIKERMIKWAKDLEKQYQYGNTLNNIEKEAGALVNLKIAIERLYSLSKEPEELPNRLTKLSDGSSSVSQLLGDQMLALTRQPLGLEKAYLFYNIDLPKAKANFFVRIWESIKRFFYSFTYDGYSASKSSENEIEIWVNRPRQYVELMQKMIDEEFTPQSGIKVKLSLMPDENKLVLANAANTQPDIAMGVSNWIPYDLAIRGALLDLRQFTGYEELVSHFNKGALIPYVFEEGMYAIPETQDFWVTFVRTDIFEELDIPIPSTWDDVIEILPELQRRGLNFYEPISAYTGMKPFVATLPFIYQFEGDLYSSDGITTALNSEENVRAIKFMTDLFKIYDMPKQVASFYNHFRYGDLPIGIANTATYIQLTIAAPEIKGNWTIAPYPGREIEEGIINRYAPVGGQAIMIFNKTKYPAESFEFIKWWMSTKTQETFAFNLQTMFGEDYLWVSANVDAFDKLPIPLAHKAVILEQWKWAMEASRVPGAYMVEREISNVWSKVVFSGENVRITIDKAVLKINRELERKMEEFGYIKDGKKVKDYKIPTIYNIDYWLTERRKEK